MGFLVVHAQQGRRHLQPADLQRRAIERRRRGLHPELPEVGAVVEGPRWAVERIFRGLLLMLGEISSSILAALLFCTEHRLASKRRGLFWCTAGYPPISDASR